MAQDSGPDEILNTHALDMVALPGGSVSSESEAEMIRGLLEASGIPALVSSAAELPNFGYEVRVPRGRMIEAAKLVEQARAAGPEAAAEAEAQNE